MLRKTVSSWMTRVINTSARHYIAGAQVADAVAVCTQAEAHGLGTTIGPWNDDADPPDVVQGRYVEALNAIIEHRLNSYLSLKVPCLDYDWDRLCALLDRAREFGIRVHFDSLGPETVDRSLQLLERACARGGPLGCTLPSAWARSLQDAGRVAQLPVAVRVVKGQWPDPDHPGWDVRQAYLKLIDALCGRSALVAVATHDRKLIGPSLERLRAGRTPCELEQLFGLPLRLEETREFKDVRVRMYIPYGHAFLIYASAQVRRPVILWWLLRDAVFSKGRLRLTGKGF